MILVGTPSRSQGRGPRGPSGRSRPDAAGTSGWVDASGAVRARLDTIGGTPVVRVVAELDRHALRPCREALDQVLASSPAAVVVDLEATREATSITMAFLGCMRRYVQARGSDLVLVSAPADLREAMDRAHVLPPHVFTDTTAEAVEVVKARAPHRPAAAVNAPAEGDRPGRRRAPGPGCCVGCLDCS